MLFSIFNTGDISMKTLTETDLVKDICKQMTRQIERNGIAKLLIYDGSQNQASVLAERVRKQLQIPQGSYQFYPLVKANGDISIQSSTKSNIKLLVVVSALMPEGNYKSYYQVSLEECLRLMGDPEYIFTHI